VFICSDAQSPGADDHRVRGLVEAPDEASAMKQAIEQFSDH
jgi:hypothetical protein